MAKPGNRGHLVVFKNVPEKRRSKPVIVESLGCDRRSGLTSLKCESCHTSFAWESDRKNRLLPDEKSLKFCSGCGRPVKGCRLPYGRNPKATLPVSADFSQIQRSLDRSWEPASSGT